MTTPADHAEKLAGFLDALAAAYRAEPDLAGFNLDVSLRHTGGVGIQVSGHVNDNRPHLLALRRALGLSEPAPAGKTLVTGRRVWREWTARGVVVDVPVTAWCSVDEPPTPTEQENPDESR